MRRHVLHAVLPAASLAALLIGPLATSTTLEHPAQLSATPGGQPVAVLMAGATLSVLETREGWSRVSLEGWIPAPGSAAAEPAPPAPAPAPAVTAPAVDPAPAQAAPGSQAGGVGGIVFIMDKDGRTHPGSRIAVRLLSSSSGWLEDITELRDGCAARRDPLLARAEELKDQAGRALRSVENTTRAFEESDAAKAERRRVLAEVEALDRECRAREDGILQEKSVQNTLTDAEGRYRIEDVAPGTYLLQATLDAAQERHDWLLQLTVAPGGRVTLDLTPGNRTSSQPRAPGR